jgi:septal ring factor EnvC (AmiA/AmiB activator)
MKNSPDDRHRAGDPLWTSEKGRSLLVFTPHPNSDRERKNRQLASRKKYEQSKIDQRNHLDAQIAGLKEENKTQKNHILEVERRCRETERKLCEVERKLYEANVECGSLFEFLQLIQDC